MPHPLRAKRFLLTYSQVTNVAFTASNLADWLFTHHEPTWLEVAQEFHQDGGIHFHVCIIFDNVKRGPMGMFDYLLHHPNIEVIGHGQANLQRVRKYIRKTDPEVDDFFEARGEVPSYSDITETERYGWGRILREATTIDEFCALVKEHHPKEWVLRHHDILAFASNNYNSPSAYVPEWPRESYTVPAEVDDWVANVLGEVCLSFAPSPGRAFSLSVGS